MKLGQEIQQLSLNILIWNNMNPLKIWAYLLVNMILGSEQMDNSGDLSGDGTINILDVILLVNLILENP